MFRFVKTRLKKKYIFGEENSEILKKADVKVKELSFLSYALGHPVSCYKRSSE